MRAGAAEANAEQGEKARNFERTRRDREERAVYRRTAVMDDKMPAHANPLMSGERPTMRGMMKQHGLEDNPENRAVAREMLTDATSARFAGIEMRGVSRKTQRNYDVEARRGVVERSSRRTQLRLR